MKRIGTCAAIAFGWAAVLAAQGAGQQPGQQPGRSGGPDDSRTSQTSPATTMTWTGCLERGSAASSGSAPGAPGAASSGVASFILTDATMKGGAGATSPGATGTAGAGTPGAAGAAGAATGRTYALEGTASELTSHVNKRVEVTGTMASSTGSAAGTPSTPGATSGAGAASSASNAPRIKVASVREVPGECK